MTWRINWMGGRFARVCFHRAVRPPPRGVGAARGRRTGHLRRTMPCTPRLFVSSFPVAAARCDGFRRRARSECRRKQCKRQATASEARIVPTHACASVGVGSAFVRWCDEVMKQLWSKLVSDAATSASWSLITWHQRHWWRQQQPLCSADPRWHAIIRFVTSDAGIRACYRWSLLRCACAVPSDNLRSSISSPRTCNIPNLTSYKNLIAYLLFKTHEWLCVRMVAQLHAHN